MDGADVGERGASGQVGEAEELAEADPDADVDFDGAGKGHDAVGCELVHLIPDECGEEEGDEAQGVDVQVAALPPAEGSLGSRQGVFEEGQGGLDADLFPPVLFEEGGGGADGTVAESGDEGRDGGHGQHDGEKARFVGQRRGLVDAV